MARFIELKPGYRVNYDYASPEAKAQADQGKLNIVEQSAAAQPGGSITYNPYGSDLFINPALNRGLYEEIFRERPEQITQLGLSYQPRPVSMISSEAGRVSADKLGTQIKDLTGLIPQPTETKPGEVLPTEVQDELTPLQEQTQKLEELISLNTEKIALADTAAEKAKITALEDERRRTLEEMSRTLSAQAKQGEFAVAGFRSAFGGQPGRYSASSGAGLTTMQQGLERSLQLGRDKIMQANQKYLSAISETDALFDRNQLVEANRKLNEVLKIKQDYTKEVAAQQKELREQREKLQERQNEINRDLAVSSLVGAGFTDKTQMLTALNEQGFDITADELKKSLDAQKPAEDEKKGISDILLDLNKLGNVPDEIKDAVANSGSILEAVKAAGDWLQTGGGDLGEALAIKRDLISRGITPPPLEQLLVRVANQKAKTANATALGLLTTAQSGLINTISTSFEGSPIVKNFIEIQNKYQNTLANTGQGSGAADIAIIYDFMKTLDPTSVVRETEYATGAQKSGNIFAGKLAYLNGLIDPKGGFVSEEAKKSILAVITSRFETAKKQYQNLRNEKVSTLEKRGIPDAGQFLTEFDFENPASAYGQIVGSEEQKQEQITVKLTDIKTTNPVLYKVIADMFISINSETGQPYSADEILQAFPELNQ